MTCWSISGQCFTAAAAPVVIQLPVFAAWWQQPPCHLCRGAQCLSWGAEPQQTPQRAFPRKKRAEIWSHLWTSAVQSPSWSWWSMPRAVIWISVQMEGRSQSLDLTQRAVPKITVIAPTLTHPLSLLKDPLTSGDGVVGHKPLAAMSGVRSDRQLCGFRWWTRLSCAANQQEGLYLFLALATKLQKMNARSHSTSVSAMGLG